MKRLITCSAAIALLFTSVQADFVFGDVFKDLKQTDNSKAYTQKAPSADFMFGDVFKDLKHTDNTKGYTVKAPNTDFVFGDVFKDLKNSV